MKQLFWKEWREQRFLPLGAAILCFLLQIGFFAMCLLGIGGERLYDYTQSGTQMLAWVLWSFFAILAGSGLISQEIGTGTLSFLFALPTSRRQVWLVKVVNGVFTMLLCALAVAVVNIILNDLAGSDLLSRSGSLGTVLFSSDAANALLCAFGCFSVSIAISPLLDRYISAAAVSVGICLILAILIGMGTTGYDTPGSPAGLVLQYRVSYAIVWICIPLFTAISYWTFTHGETLRSAKRFNAAGRASLASLIAFLVLFTFARSYVMAQSSSLVTPEGYTPPQAITTTTENRPMALYVTRETDSQGHEQYIVQPSDARAIFRLKMDWKVDGGQVGGSSNPRALSNGPVHIGAWIDTDEDMLIKSVLSAQGMKISNPGNVTFGLHVIGNGVSFVPLTLYFKHGADWSANSNGLSIDSSRPYRVGDKLTVLDEIFTDNAGGGKALDLGNVPNDASSDALFKSGAAHRVTVTATFEPAN